MRNKDGFTLMEVLGIILIMALLTPILADLWRRGLEDLRARSAAEHFTAVAQAAEKYLRLNHAALLAASSANSGPAIALADLRTADCLSNMVADTNVWNQGYQVTTRKTAEGDLAAVVLTVGGRGHSDDDPRFANILVPAAAALARAGFVPTALTGPGNVLRGPHGGWEVDLGTLGLAGQAGHLGLMTSLDSASLKQDFLYRVAVPDHPELNAMQTELDMTDHAIRGVREVQYEPHAFESLAGFCAAPEDEGRTFLDAARGLYLCRDGQTRVLGDSGNSLLMQGATLAASGQMIDKPLCPAGSATHPEIFVAPSVGAPTTTGEKVQPMHSLQAWAVEASETAWQVYLRVLASDNTWVYPTPNYGRMIVLTSCVRD